MGTFRGLMGPTMGIDWHLDDLVYCLANSLLYLFI